MKIGEIDILPIVDGCIVGRLPSTKPLPDEGSSAWQQQHGMFRSGGFIESTVGGFLIRSGDRLALVDAGLGQAFPSGYNPPVIAMDDDDDPIIGPLRAQGVPEEHLRRLADDLGRVQVEQGQLPASLRAVGVGPEEVTDLIFTHLHFDHIGWATAEGSAFFPNATIRCASADLEHFLPGTPEDFFTGRVYGAVTVAERLGPVLDRVETWESDGGLFPGVDVRLAPGHTPGSSVVVISDGTQRAHVARRHHPLPAGVDGRRLQSPGRPGSGTGGFGTRGVRARAGGKRRPSGGEPFPGAAVRPIAAERGHAPLDVRPELTRRARVLQRDVRSSSGVAGLR